MSVSVDYTGRTVDLFIFQNAKVSGEALIHLGFGGDEGGKVTTGVQKMAQTWAILFLTEVGTIGYNPEIGTAFVSKLRAGLIRDEADVQTEFGLAAADVFVQMNTPENVANLPPDEQLQTAELVNFTMNKGKGLLTLYVRLTSQVGTTHDILLPIPVPIQ